MLNSNLGPGFVLKWELLPIWKTIAIITIDFFIVVEVELSAIWDIFIQFDNHWYVYEAYIQSRILNKCFDEWLYFCIYALRCSIFDNLKVQG